MPIICNKNHKYVLPAKTQHTYCFPSSEAGCGKKWLVRDLTPHSFVWGKTSRREGGKKTQTVFPSWFFTKPGTQELFQESHSTGTLNGRVPGSSSALDGGGGQILIIPDTLADCENICDKTAGKSGCFRKIMRYFPAGRYVIRAIWTFFFVGTRWHIWIQCSVLWHFGEAHQVTQPGTFYFILLAHRRHVLRYSPNVNKSWTVVMWGTGARPLAGFFSLLVEGGKRWHLKKSRTCTFWGLVQEVRFSFNLSGFGASEFLWSQGVFLLRFIKF